MKKICVLLLFAIVLTLLAGSACASGNEYTQYLRINGIEGESTDPDHHKWIDLISFTVIDSVEATPL